MNRDEYLNHGFDTAPAADSRQLRAGEDMSALVARRYATRASAVVDEVAPGVGLGDMPSEWSAGVRAVMARTVGGENPRAVSRDALALEMHTPEEYWDRAHKDFSGIINTYGPKVEGSRESEAFTRTGLAMVEHVQARQGDEAARPGERDSVVLAMDMLNAEGVTYAPKDRQILAAHALVHARMGNRDVRQFEQAVQGLPKEAEAVVAHVRETKMEGAVMALAREFGQLNPEEMFARSTGMQDVALAEVRLARETAQKNAGALGEMLFPLQSTQGIEQQVRVTEMLGADKAKAFAAHRETNMAIMGLFPTGGNVHAMVLATEVARGRVEEREANISQIMAGKFGAGRRSAGPDLEQ